MIFPTATIYWFMKAMVASAVPLEDWGFCPVMRLPSTTV